MRCIGWMKTQRCHSAKWRQWVPVHCAMHSSATFGVFFFRLSLSKAPVSKESFQTSTMYMVNVTQWSLCVFVYLCLCPFVCSTHVSRHRTSKEDFMKKKKGGGHYCMSALAIKAQTCDFFLEIVKIRSETLLTLLRHKQQTEHFQQAAKTNPTPLHPFKF